MRTRIVYCLIALVILGLSSQPVAAQAGRQVWVFYMGFWTPDGWVASENVLTDTPAEYYDTKNANTAATQIQQARNAGIDAFIANWFGMNDTQTTSSLDNLLQQAYQQGFKIGAAYDLFPSNVAKDKQSVIDSLNWLIANRTTHPAYLRFDGKPVIYFAFQENTGFGSGTWEEIRNTVDPNYNTIWVAEGLNGCCLHGGVFDGMYAFNLAWGDPATTATRQFNLMRNQGGYFYTATAHPGWDESLVAARDNRPNPSAARNRQDGEFMTRSWNGAISSGSGIILIVSWNEYMEGSHIEPSSTYGSTALDTLRPLIRDWKAGRTPSVAAEAQNNNSSSSSSQVNSVPAGTRLTINVESMFVRAEPSTSGAILASVFQGQTYDVLGESNGWYKVSVNGQEGFVAGDYVVLSQ
jgi:Glycosyl hydrolase family 99/Bacterial SH3 domain